MFPDVTGRRDKRKLDRSGQLRRRPSAPEDGARIRSGLIGPTQPIWVPCDDDVDMLLKGTISRGRCRRRPPRERQRDRLDRRTSTRTDWSSERFNRQFFTAGDSREPELAGIWGAVGRARSTRCWSSLALSFPIGVAAAIYLEEFAPKNRWTDLIEVNINNLAAVPSIVFGLLGLAVFLNFFGLPRSAPLVGGLVLTLMTLPTDHHCQPGSRCSRCRRRSGKPPTGRGCLDRCRWCSTTSCRWPLPGMLTGTIIGMARALGRDGAAADDRHGGLYRRHPRRIHRSGHGPAGADLPVGRQPRAGLCRRTSAAIMVLLGFLIVMNAAAVILRKTFERRW